MEVKIDLNEHEIKTIFWLAGFVEAKKNDYENPDFIAYAIKTAIEQSKP